MLLYPRLGSDYRLLQGKRSWFVEPVYFYEEFVVLPVQEYHILFPNIWHNYFICLEAKPFPVKPCRPQTISDMDLGFSARSYLKKCYRNKHWL